MASALEQLQGSVQDPGEAISFQEFYNQQMQGKYGSNSYAGSGKLNPDDMLNRFLNVFTGDVNSAKQKYDQYLSEHEYQKNKYETQKANEITFNREDTQIQRLMEDYSKAGLNPYLLLNGGNLSSGVVSSAAQAASYKRHDRQEEKNAEKTRMTLASMISSAIKILFLMSLTA